MAKSGKGYKQVLYFVSFMLWGCRSGQTGTVQGRVAQCLQGFKPLPLHLRKKMKRCKFCGHELNEDGFCEFCGSGTFEDVDLDGENDFFEDAD